MGGGAVLSRVQEGLVYTVAFGQVPKGREGASHASVWEKTSARSLGPACLHSARVGAAGCWEMSRRGSGGPALAEPDRPSV